MHDGRYGFCMIRKIMKAVNEFWKRRQITTFLKDCETVTTGRKERKDRKKGRVSGGTFEMFADDWW